MKKVIFAVKRLYSPISEFVVFDDKRNYSTFILCFSLLGSNTYIHNIYTKKNILLKDIKIFASIKYYIYLCTQINQIT